VLLHGNPTSSYVWRHVIDEVAAHGRCLAPDLLGMGDSEKLADSGPTSYTFEQHRDALDAWLDAVGATERVTLVGHDWGSALGFDWAYRHPNAVRGIAYLEAIVAPVTWADLPPPAAELLKALRSPAGEQMILEQNMFIEALLPSGVSKVLEPDVLDEYRRPYLQEGESRRPTLSWARQIPIDGEPAEVDRIVREYSSWMARNDIPKLFINGDPGMVLVGRARDFCRTWPNQTELTVPGLHFLQEDSGQKIGHAIAEWLGTIVKP
jgi:haloalkane dehalogenase